jgi:LytR cell envelope-related transcriptional attenuator
MAEQRHGYRAQRLKRRRAERSRSWQSITLYVLAGVVAFAAVMGSVYLARRLTAKHVRPTDASFVALVRVGAGESGTSPLSALLLYDQPKRSYSLFTIPRSTLLVGLQDEYLLAGDITAQPEYAAILRKLIKAPVQYRLDLSYDALEKLVGGGQLDVELARSATVQLEGAWHTYKTRFSLPASMLTAALSAPGKTGTEEAAFDMAVLRAVFEAAAMNEAGASAAVEDVAAGDGTGTADARAILRGMLDGHVWVGMLPATGRVSEGQFVYRPDNDQILAQITRRAPGYRSKYTVQIENGSGLAGIGQLVAERLAILDVNLPQPKNADSFDYRRTQIYAGSDAFAVAGDVRAILRRGAVLRGAGLPASGIVVIVGRDLKPSELR